MRIGEIVGGVALIGLLVLLGLAVTDDGTPGTVTSDTSAFVFDTAASTSLATSAGATTTTTTGAGTTAGTGSPTSTTTAVPATDAPPTTPAPVAPTTTLIPPAERAAVRVRVLNGGGPPGSAAALTARLRDAGFDPAPPGNASPRVDATTVLFAPGAEVAAATVNSVVGAPADRTVVAAGDDPNWTRSGGELMVLVVVGPTGP